MSSGNKLEENEILDATTMMDGARTPENNPGQYLGSTGKLQGSVVDMENDGSHQLLGIQGDNLRLHAGRNPIRAIHNFDHDQSGDSATNLIGGANNEKSFNASGISKLGSPGRIGRKASPGATPRIYTRTSPSPHRGPSPARSISPHPFRGSSHHVRVSSRTSPVAMGSLAYPIHPNSAFSIVRPSVPFSKRSNNNGILPAQRIHQTGQPNRDPVTSANISTSIKTLGQAEMTGKSSSGIQTLSAESSRPVAQISSGTSQTKHSARNAFRTLGIIRNNVPESPRLPTRLFDSRHNARSEQLSRECNFDFPADDTGIDSDNELTYYDVSLAPGAARVASSRNMSLNMNIKSKITNEQPETPACLIKRPYSSTERSRGESLIDITPDTAPEKDRFLTQNSQNLPDEGTYNIYSVASANSQAPDTDENQGEEPYEEMSNKSPSESSCESPRSAHSFNLSTLNRENNSKDTGKIKLRERSYSWSPRESQVTRKYLSRNMLRSMSMVSPNSDVPDHLWTKYTLDVEVEDMDCSPCGSDRQSSKHHCRANLSGDPMPLPDGFDQFENKMKTLSLEGVFQLERILGTYKSYLLRERILPSDLNDKNDLGYPSINKKEQPTRNEVDGSIELEVSPETDFPHHPEDGMGYAVSRQASRCGSGCFVFDGFEDEMLDSPDDSKTSYPLDYTTTLKNDPSSGNKAPSLKMFQSYDRHVGGFGSPSSLSSSGTPFELLDFSFQNSSLSNRSHESIVMGTPKNDRRQRSDRSPNSSQFINKATVSGPMLRPYAVSFGGETGKVYKRPGIFQSSKGLENFKSISSAFGGTRPIKGNKSAPFEGNPRPLSSTRMMRVVNGTVL